MKAKNAIIWTLLSFLFGAVGPTLAAAFLFSVPASAAQATQPIAKHLGVVKTINGSVLTVAPDSGPEISVTVQPNARILRLAPGDKDLKNATPLSLQDLHVGDTIRVRGFGQQDAKALNALEVIVITQSAVAAMTDQMRQDWQKRGVAGVVDSVDVAAGTITLSIPGFGEKKTIAIHAAKNTVIHRYAPDSARPEDAKLVSLQDVHVGDQLRARGNRTADGTEFAAEEIYTGTFPYVEGTIKSMDASAGTLSVQDVLSKKTVQLKITADSQLHQVPAEMAQRMAFMLKRVKSQSASGAAASSSASSPASVSSGAPSTQSGPSAGGVAGGMGGASGGTRSGGGSGLQRMLDQTPAVKLADLHKGDALAILATEGTLSSGGTVIKLFSGVEPILEAAPGGSQAMMLAPWSLGGAPGGDAASQ